MLKIKHLLISTIYLYFCEELHPEKFTWVPRLTQSKLGTMKSPWELKGHRHVTYTQICLWNKQVCDAYTAQMNITPQVFGNPSYCNTYLFIFIPCHILPIHVTFVIFLNYFHFLPNTFTFPLMWTSNNTF